jgi:DNA-binding LacI/PurR family transcriptional regulator/biotin operon repressor
MEAWNRQTAAQQIASHLRGEIKRGRWSRIMPGQKLLSEELGASHNAVEAALRQLEHEGILIGQGIGRRRRIVAADANNPRPLKIGLLDHDPIASTAGYVIELQHLLTEAGHTAFFTEKSLLELGMKVTKISRLVKQTEADAWVVIAGSREVLGWFARQSVPAFALFGYREWLPIAAIGPDKPIAYAAATRHLLELGHQRIVLLSRRSGGVSGIRLSEKAFLAELADQGITTGDFNLPMWKETPEGLMDILTLLFKVTPPTAMIIDEAPLFAATQQFLANRGIRVPQQVSLICTDPDPTFAWCLPTIAHIRWDAAPVVRRIVRWAANVSHGELDIKQSLVPAEFVPGGTVGPVPLAAE